MRARRAAGHRTTRGPARATAFAVADLGTGSGALALALARELPDAEVWATDVSDDALAVARANLAGVGSAATRVRLARGSWFDALPTELRGRLRLVVSNPPYVAEHEVPDLPADVAEWEPRDALVSGPTGLRGDRDDRAQRAASGSTPPAACWWWSSRRTRRPRHAELADASPASPTVDVVPDLAGRDRVLVARRRRAWLGSRYG